jgi:hypothetical protein
MHRSIEGLTELSLGGTELGAPLVCETDFGGTPATIAKRFAGIGNARFNPS